MRYIRKIDGAMEEASASPFRGASYYLANDYLPYPGTLPLSRLDIVGGAIVEQEAAEEIAVPRVFSKLKLRDNLAELRLWDAIRSAIESPEAVSERWELAQTIREDDPDFVAIKTQLIPQFEAAETNLNEFLNQCQVEV